MIAYFLNAVLINRIFDNYTENDEAKVKNESLSIKILNGTTLFLKGVV